MVRAINLGSKSLICNTIMFAINFKVLGQYDPTDLPAGKFGDYACDIPWDIIESVMKYINTLVCVSYKIRL